MEGTFQEPLDKIWDFINEAAYQNHCKYKAKYAPGVITCYCCIEGCKSFYRFIKEDHLYKLINCCSEHFHGGATSKMAEGEPIEESIVSYITSLISGLEKREISCKTIIKKTIDQFGANHVSPDRIQYIYYKNFTTDWLKSWAKLPNYITKLIETGINADIEVQTENMLKKIEYIFFEAPYAREFVRSSCFPKILMVDGTFLKPIRTKGVLLILSTVSPDHIALPLAGAIVDQENNRSYTYFFEKCQNFLSDIENLEISIISDQHQSILSVLSQICPSWKYSPCAFHIIQKFKKAHAMFYILIKSTNTELYQARLQAFKKRFPIVYENISEFLPLITRVLGAPFRYNYVTDSVLEGINGSLKEIRKYDPIYLIEGFLKFCISQWNNQVNELYIHNSTYINRIEGIICSMQRNELEVTELVNGCVYHVQEKEDGHTFQYKVTITRIENNTRIIGANCTCGTIEETLHPCIHVIMIFKKYLIPIPESIMGQLHLRSENKRVFRKIMLDLPQIELIEPDQNIDATTFVKKRAGRPANAKRYRGTWEKVYKRKRKCSACNQEGHYAKSRKCPKNPLNQHYVDDLVDANLELRENENGIIPIDILLHDISSEEASHDISSEEEPPKIVKKISRSHKANCSRQMQRMTTRSSSVSMAMRTRSKTKKN